MTKRCVQLGIAGMGYPKELGGTMPPDYDAFYELIMVDEMARAGGGHVMGQGAINSMALPPILNYGSDYLKNLVARDVIQGRKHICLAISEPQAGRFCSKVGCAFFVFRNSALRICPRSDVAGIRTTAVLQGDEYVVNGQKKWITGGSMADYFTTVVRTGEDGMGGISLLLIERDRPGLENYKLCFVI